MLVVDLDKCVGCCACEVGCQQWHQADRDEKRIRVHTIGPQMQGGKLMTIHSPEATDFCDLCAASRDHSPFCVEVCPVRALQSCDEKGLLALLMSGKRYQICKF